MRKFIFTMSVVWVIFYMVLLLISKMADYLDDQEEYTHYFMG